MNSESSVKLIEDWRERWEPVTTHTKPMRVLEVWEDKGGTAALVNNEGRAFLCYGWLAPKSRPKTYRPWKREEVPVGSVVREKSSGYLFMINGATEAYVYLSEQKYTMPGIFNNFVLHATSPDGTWVPTEQCPKCGVEE